jgi:hypothetical protein
VCLSISLVIQGTFFPIICTGTQLPFFFSMNNFSMPDALRTLPTRWRVELVELPGQGVQAALQLLAALLHEVLPGPDGLNSGARLLGSHLSKAAVKNFLRDHRRKDQTVTVPEC